MNHARHDGSTTPSRTVFRVQENANLSMPLIEVGLGVINFCLGAEHLESS